MDDWKKDLKTFFKHLQHSEDKDNTELIKVREEIKKFYAKKVGPAFKEIKNELEKYDRKIDLDLGSNSAKITVEFAGRKEYLYSVNVKIDPSGEVYPFPTDCVYSDKLGKWYESEVVFMGGAQNYRIMDISKEDIIKNFIHAYKKHGPK